MGLLGNLLKNAIGDGISKGIGDAIGKATEKAVKPAAENLANKAADHINTSAEAIEKSQNELSEAMEKMDSSNLDDESEYSYVLNKFPRWTFSAIENIYGDKGEDYSSATICVSLTDDIIEAYQKVLAANGFNGDFQIQKKIVDGKECIVDFSFVMDSEIKYFIR